MVPAPFVVVLDANVLYPFTLRDTLLRAAAAGLYQARWSAEILDEATRNLTAKSVMTEAQAARLVATMQRAFPDAEVADYDGLTAGLQNDEKDRHVAAVALKSGAQVIVTSNLKDFKNLPDGLEAQSPDEFLENLFDLDPDGFIDLLREQAADLQHPPVSLDELLARLARAAPGLVAAVRAYGWEG